MQPHIVQVSVAGLTAPYMPPPLTALGCQCPRHTLGESNLAHLKAMNIALGIIAILTFLAVAQAVARAAEAEPASKHPRRRLRFRSHWYSPSSSFLIWCSGHLVQR